MNKNILLIGFGQMGAAIAQGLLRKGWAAEHIAAIDPTPQAQDRAALLGITCSTAYTNQPADVILLAVKPQMMAEALAPLKATAAHALVLSIAAGITLGRLHELLGDGPHIRAMPNTPAAIGEGVTVCVANTFTTLDHQETAEAILHALGEVCWVEDEGLMNAVTAVSGSGPAYFFALMEALEEAAVTAGLPAPLARTLVLKTAAGAGALAWQARAARSPTDQRIAVTSPGGTTEAGLKVLADADFKKLVLDVITAAKNRGEDLAK